MRLDKLAARAGATTVTLPHTQPQGLFTVNPSFPGVSFELNTFSLYCQTSQTDPSANQFSINLISEVAKRTGGRPIVRVGGITGDRVKWNSSQTVPVVPAPSTTQTGDLTIGPSFWALTQLLAPAKVRWMPSISYTEHDYTQANEAAKSILSGIGADNLAAIEIGNEPNFYSGGDPPAATAQEFADRFQAIAANITKAAGLPPSVGFAGPDVGSETNGYIPWDAADIFANTSFDDTNNLAYATDHWYRCLSGSCTLPDLLSHASTVADTAKHIKPMNEFFQSYKGGRVPFYLDEINVQTGGTSNASFSASFATALYGTDFMMHLMSLGVAAVNWEQVYGSVQNVWQPSDYGSTPAQTKNTYYAILVAAEFIGTGGRTKVAELAPGNNDGTTFSSYVAYEHNIAKRVALCNLNYWDLSVGTTRPEPVVTLDGLSPSVKTVTVKYLTNPGGAGQNSTDTTFGGSQWTFASQGTEVKNVAATTIKVPVKGGSALIPVPYSSVAIVYL
ncbi:uncharacterized protein SPSK_09101 [Sporothrix schenckii 1099-18]|uniref:Beta-glucuronidase C-terminal domain-containing protein n=1 Tax=Sporothrix schenckii 1099-18 TaxID=1397361 RepID=A0A0F2M4Z9_SPOSC|nr:uncharacterized protein SPSK_09101 [Sporothrix schenckii 1099-18]KJR84169.1 hypothetical protein SPSK_09101 [Sporothrix schenckii 1099-18]